MEEFIAAIKADNNGDHDTFLKYLWKDLVTAVNILQTFPERLTPEETREIVISHYIHHGDSSPTIRKFARGLLKTRPDD